MKDLIQIAGIRDLQEATMLIECGVDHIGFPLGLPMHGEDIPEAEAARIVRSLPSQARAVLITYLDNADDIISLCRSIRAHIVQLHGDASPDTLLQIQVGAPDVDVIKSLIVREGNLGDLKAAVRESSHLVNGFIVDTYDPDTGARGATGKTHDWTTSRQLAEYSSHPIILAGGLTPKNVREAILQVRPAGVDAHTGVEGVDGWKDPELVKAFVSEARKGFAMI
ncbi:MAG: phosphoribosylanthranilate isomerase [Candidatus Latescibacteria bacterium]|nr:phosphoribosylanthranilate isomerase [Candidatus Latescibacterota bacterium]NIM22490.1 phosphoribosylanthranilate isomerase [Candidatus Latescibacterota bacterium]NIM64804.1 phosphoribosylanthranilate isomerase [Candidatus Latescibacterota bacterium]NIO01312.1 phosphoribosylanthranilate isomerase [Candidatus Latescibacterota bacterium]NIO27801.1 phosphoribosylanthranilate isomerase [Candidatus Latescibacterota bacterium]